MKNQSKSGATNKISVNRRFKKRSAVMILASTLAVLALTFLAIIPAFINDTNGANSAGQTASESSSLGLKPSAHGQDGDDSSGSLAASTEGEQAASSDSVHTNNSADSSKNSDGNSQAEGSKDSSQQSADKDYADKQAEEPSSNQSEQADQSSPDAQKQPVNDNQFQKDNGCTNLGNPGSNGWEGATIKFALKATDTLFKALTPTTSAETPWYEEVEITLGADDNEEYIYFFDEWTFAVKDKVTEKSIPKWDVTVPCNFKIKGNVTIAIADGMRITVNKQETELGSGRPAIDVSDPSARLTIEGGKICTRIEDEPPVGSGIINCISSDKAAAIGGGNKCDGHDITINACEVNATSNGSGAAIGGGAEGYGKNIQINGGYITAKCTGGYAANDWLRGGAGIGNGSGNILRYMPNSIEPNWFDELESKMGGDFNVQINGGKIDACGGYYAAGIGGTSATYGNKIYINGGDVKAVGGDSAAGIGSAALSSEYYSAFLIKISGGKIDAYAGVNDLISPPAIGGPSGACGIKICGSAIVNAYASENASAIGGGTFGDISHFEFAGNSKVTANVATDSSGDYLTSTGIGGNSEVKKIRMYENSEIHAYGYNGAAIGACGKSVLLDIQIYDNSTVYAYQLGTNSAAIGGNKSSYVGAESSASGNFIPGLSIYDNPYIYAETTSGCSAIGNYNSSCHKDDNNISIDKNLKVYDNQASSEITSRTGPDGSCGWKDISKSSNLIVSSPTATEMKINVSSQTDIPTVGYESTVNYDISTQYLDLVENPCNVVWYNDSAGTDPADSAPAYLTVNKIGSAAAPVVSMYACPVNDASRQYCITPAGTYYFRVEATVNGKTIKSEPISYTIGKQTVNITSDSASKIFDGTPLTCKKFTQDKTVVAKKTSNSVNNEPFTIYKNVVTECYDWTSITQPSTVDNEFKVLHVDNELNMDNYEFNQVPGTLSIINAEYIATGDNYYGTYDGDTHTFCAKVVSASNIVYKDATVKYQTSTDYDPKTGEGTWSQETTDNPEVKDVPENDKHTLYIKAWGEREGTVITDSSIYTMTVIPRDVTINSANAYKRYDGKPLTANDVKKDITYSGAGFVYDDGVEIKFSEESTITAVGEVYNKFSYNFKSGKETNYDIDTAFGSLVVEVKDEPISISSFSYSKVYDGNAFIVASSGWKSAGTLADGDSLSVTIDCVDPEKAPVDAGEYWNSFEQKVTNSNGDDVTNCYKYNIFYGQLSIIQRPLPLISDSACKVYDGTPLTAETVTVGKRALVGEQEITFSDFASVTDPTKEPVPNTFKVNFVEESGAKAGNYNQITTYGSLEVLEAASLVGTDVYCVYDATKHEAPAKVTQGSLASDIEYSTSKDGETWSAYSPTVPSLTDAGKLYIKAKATVSSQEVYAEYSLTVAPRPVTISTNSASKEYDSTPLITNKDAYVIGGDGFVDGQGADITITGTQTDVGESNNSFTYKLKLGTDSKNYIITEQPGKLVVSKNTSPITITTGSASWTYSGTPLTCADYDVNGYICDGDSLEVVTNGTITDVGSTYNTIGSCRVVRASDGRDITDFYTFANPVLGTLMVNPRSVVINTGSASKVYDGAALTCADEPTYTGDGFMGNDGVKVSVTGTQTVAGYSLNNATYQFKEGTNPNNYVVTTNCGTLEVSKRPVTVTSGSAVSTYSQCEGGLSNPSTTITVNNFVEGEMAAGYPKATTVLQRPATESDCPVYADNKIEYTWAGNGNPANYEITQNLGKLAIVANSASEAIAVGYVGKYDGKAHGGKVETNLVDATIKYSIDGGQSYGSDAPTRTDVGTTNVKVKVSNATTTLECEYKIVIEKRNLELTAGSATKIYDGDALECDDVVVGGDGYVNDESADISVHACKTGTTEQVTLKNVGSADNVIVNVQDKDKFKTSNYNIAKNSGKLDITKRNVVLLSESKGILEENKVLYDGETKTYTKVTDVGKAKNIPNTGFVKDEGVVATGFTECTDAGTYRNDYTISPKPDTNLDNYNVRQSLGVIKISPRVVIISSANASKMYDGVALTNDKIIVNGDGFATNEGATYDVTGKQTEVGKSFNNFTYTLKTNTKPINYEISTDLGILEVYANDTLRVVVPESKTYTYDGMPHGEPAEAFVGDDPYDGPIWYSTDGGANFTDVFTTRSGVGTTEVTVSVSKSGYATAEGKYTITVVPAEPTPVGPDDMNVISVNQDDLDAVAKQYLNTSDYYYAFARVEVDKNTEAEPGDLDKIKSAAPGKQLKYSNVKLLLTAYDKDGNETCKDKDIGNENKVPVRITYHSDLANQTDFQALRVHKGELAELPLGAESAVNGEYWVMNQDAGTVMVSATKYSTYAFAYNFVQDNPQDNPVVPTGSGMFSTTSTGDGILIVAVCAVVTALCVAGALSIRRRRVSK